MKALCAYFSNTEKYREVSEGRTTHSSKVTCVAILSGFFMIIIFWKIFMLPFSLLFYKFKYFDGCVVFHCGDNPFDSRGVCGILES